VSAGKLGVVGLHRRICDANGGGASGQNRSGSVVFIEVVFIKTPPPVRIMCCRASRRVSTSDMRSTIRACLPKQSRSSVARWPHGATNTTAKPMTAPITDGRLRACPSTKRSKPPALSTSSPSCSRRR
jgi:hypothetical protein